MSLYIASKRTEPTNGTQIGAAPVRLLDLAPPDAQPEAQFRYTTKAYYG